MSDSNAQAPFRTGDVVYLISGGPAMTVVSDESQYDGSRTVTAAYFNGKDEFDVIEVLPAMLTKRLSRIEITWPPRTPTPTS